ncbi:ATP-binding protein [Variovorax sp. J22P240]|uniref:ATP-binding protein n=1 Tax=Variovorax sp. J22P240 TaxID=3053514 RepID=UPI00257688C9|nr:ATP-binding protein [Variovorax sp. J22P240]MDM0002627.1 ATP-binding protein [Variovorax sp. J22P240]
MSNSLVRSAKWRPTALAAPPSKATRILAGPGSGAWASADGPMQPHMNAANAHQVVRSRFIQPPLEEVMDDAASNYPPRLSVTVGVASLPVHAALQEQLSFERLLSELSVAFISLAARDIDRAIDQALAQVVFALGIDRSTLNRLFPLTGRAEVTHSFAIEGVDPVPRFPSARETNPWALAKAMANESIVFSRLDDLPPEASVDKETWRRIGLKSHVMMPIVVAGQLHGTLNFGCVRSERSWSNHLVARMRLLAQIFGSALGRKRAQEELDLAIGFERLASSILASLVLTGPGEENHGIALGLRQIGEFIGAERVALWHRGVGIPFGLTQQWYADGFEGPAAEGKAVELPWVFSLLAGGSVVRIAHLSELPAEGQADAATLRQIGVRSLLAVPITVDGCIAGALTLASIELEHEWPDVLTPGVSLLAEVFANLHARDAAERRKMAAEVEAAHWREQLAHLVRVHTAGEMSVALAHEINQPLGAIENYALAARRCAKEAVPDVVRLCGLIDKVIGQATRAGDIVARMRSMVQRHELEPKLIDIGRAVDGCMSMVKTDCALRDINIGLGEEPPLPLVVIDEIHLQQVILNLLRNAMEAIEAAPPGGERDITVDLSLNERDEVVVQVADRGIGIAEGDLERIFESFYSTKSKGLGVGLAICRKLIEAHGGTLWAAHRDGGGAMLSFTLPTATS